MEGEEREWQDQSDLIAVSPARPFKWSIGRKSEVHVALVLNTHSKHAFRPYSIKRPHPRIHVTLVRDCQHLHLLRAQPDCVEVFPSVAGELPQPNHVWEDTSTASYQGQRPARHILRLPSHKNSGREDLQDPKIAICTAADDNDDSNSYLESPASNDDKGTRRWKVALRKQLDAQVRAAHKRGAHRIHKGENWDVFVAEDVVDVWVVRAS